MSEARQTLSGRWIVIAIVAVTAIVVSISAVMLFGHPRGKTAPPPSIAVLPVIGDKSGAVTSEVIDALETIPNFKVADAVLYGDKRQDTRPIGDKLNVRTVLDASLDGTHLTIKLINAADAFQLWSHTYQLDPAFKAQLARDIQSHLSMQ